MVITPIPDPDPAVERPFGAWATPVTSEVVVAAAVRLGEVRVDGTDVVWAEGRPGEGGRTQLVRRRADGGTDELLPEGRNARTAVHEYGGAAWWVRDGVVWFTDWADQRLYRLEPGSAPVALTPEPARPRGDRYADGELGPDGTRIVCVRERHHGDRATDVVNEIVVLDARTPGEPQVLVTGPDFVAAPRHSPDGATLAWLQWNHPAMPWDAAELVIRDLATGEETVVAGGPGESVTEPQWRPDGSLWFLSDRTDWWNLYRWLPGRDIEAVVRTEADIGVPAWAFGTSRYAVLDDGRVVVARWRDGFDGLGGAAASTARSPTSTCPSPPSARSSPRARTRSSWWRAAPPRRPGCTASTCRAQVHMVQLRPVRLRGSRRCGHHGTSAWPPTRSLDRRRCGSRPSTAPASRARPVRCSTRRSTPGSGARKGSGRRCSS